MKQYISSVIIIYKNVTNSITIGVILFALKNIFILIMHRFSSMRTFDYPTLLNFKRVTFCCTRSIFLFTQLSLRNLWEVIWHRYSRKRNTEFKNSAAVLPAAVRLYWNHLSIGLVFPRNITISRDAVVARKTSSLPYGKEEPGPSEKCYWASIKRVSLMHFI